MTDDGADSRRGSDSPSIDEPGATTAGDGPEPPTPPDSPTPAPWWRNLIYGLMVAVLFLGWLEVGLRYLYPVARNATLPNAMIRKHLTGKAFRYDPDLYWYWPTLPAIGTQINQFGFRRTKPMNGRKRTDIYRIITLGDSQTLGAGVDVDQTYSSFAESLLGPGYEVLNAGISGYRSLNVYRLLQRRILYFHPDVVVVDCMPFDSPRDDGPLVRRPLRTPRQRLERLLWESAIYHTMQLVIEKYRPQRARWLDQSGEALAGMPGEEGNHDLIIDWGKANGVKVVFMQYAVWDDGAVKCHTRPGELPPGPPVVPACDYLMASKKPATELFQDKNHLTVAGNEIVGKALADTIKAMGR